MRKEHQFEPVFDKSSEILILGTFPSRASRQSGFYYGHPKNRFWRVLAEILGNPVPQTVLEKKTFLLENRIALWDVIQSCEIEGSSDSSIKNVIPNDLGQLLPLSRIGRIFANGKKAAALYKRYMLPHLGGDIIELPSTSPANARYTMDRLIDAWRCIHEET
ncbi:MAG: DNA-deoxyinosine glycosylase [Clostridiales bacterium]|jgi:hypoxanthine-DNA glycosylase|nr:DNA-deoxyinosine glycosylase [Clostridiales bacterium]